MELTICCPKCNSENITRIDNNFKCKKCGKVFNIPSDTTKELMNCRNNYEKDFLPGGKNIKYPYNKTIHFNK